MQTITKKDSVRKMKVHREGTGLLLALFTIFFIVNLVLYHTVGKGGLFYTVAFVTTVFFLLVLNFFRSPFRRFPYDSEGLVISPADGMIRKDWSFLLQTVLLLRSKK